VMIRQPFEMPLHLFCCFHLIHTFSIHHIPTFSSMLGCHKEGDFNMPPCPTRTKIYPPWEDPYPFRRKLAGWKNLY
jgi:hypothetical protein